MKKSQVPLAETPAEKCARLVGALEDLVSQETVCVRNRDFAAVADIQQRLGPLIEHLAAHSSDTDAGIRVRMAAVIKARDESSAWLQKEMDRTRAELGELQASKRRVAQVAPAYGRAPSSRSRLNVSG